jgi:hypothetical protein
LQNRLRLEDRFRHRNAGRTRRSAPLLRSFWLTAFEGAEHLAVVRTTRDAIDVTA